jgi:predicted acylesterase/phospholipase RssA
MSETLKRRIAAPGPKKILACDGGGILGLISVEILARLEADLRAARNDPKLVLADFFDFACGTSTGAIIAACVSAGMSMGDIRKFYVDSGEQMFDKASVFKRLRYSYEDEALAGKLRAELNKALGHGAGDAPATLGDPGLRTLLMMVLRNHTTDSPWPVSNNPAAKYNQPGRRDCNLNLPLWQLVRASTAAPTFFPPEVVTFAPGTPDEYQFVFVDGGVTTYNNPAFLAFQMATAAPYKMNWATGVENMLIVSVGTGSAAKARPDTGSGRPVAAGPCQEHSLRPDERRLRRLGHGLPHPGRVPLRRRDRPGDRRHGGRGGHKQLDRRQAVRLCALRPG